VDSTRKIVDGREGFVVSESVIKMFEAGRLGKKNGKGFYSYHPDSGKRLGADETAYVFFDGNGGKNMPAEFMQDRLLMLMLNEATMCL
jgi:3-hydroxyacyl-CoA dehydrogenase/enoyl-CoA hydratase/3-hydroxybutyryl-CoA epimerase